MLPWSFSEEAAAETTSARVRARSPGLSRAPNGARQNGYPSIGLYRRRVPMRKRHWAYCAGPFALSRLATRRGAGIHLRDAIRQGQWDVLAIGAHLYRLTEPMRLNGGVVEKFPSLHGGSWTGSPASRAIKRTQSKSSLWMFTEKDWLRCQTPGPAREAGGWSSSEGFEESSRTCDMRHRAQPPL